MANELQMVMQAIKELGNNISTLDGRIGKLEHKIGKLEQRMDHIEQEMHSGFSALKQEIKDKHFDVLDHIDLLREDTLNTSLDVQRLKRKVKEAEL
ncbi:hypothetical protein NIE88_01930 [Sporolactobacillus shoreicorticis]|uniref:Uncharacterized protein n=1 Tax=Sporolactobacillus shoreicorticis TaxID=1923877 RepID=A0ABW5S0P3_9BACL|nr:hypothetical protein [Sporolactobacillus shoreicorticis]MCO7124538.1 hypothetical protein [Sporolactobacillus shoreicorticis]